MKRILFGKHGKLIICKHTRKLISKSRCTECKYGIVSNSKYVVCMKNARILKYTICGLIFSSPITAKNVEGLVVLDIVMKKTLYHHPLLIDSIDINNKCIQIGFSVISTPFKYELNIPISTIVFKTKDNIIISANLIYDNQDHRCMEIIAFTSHSSRLYASNSFSMCKIKNTHDLREKIELHFDNMIKNQAEKLWESRQ